MLNEECVRRLISKDRNKLFHNLVQRARSLRRVLHVLQDSCEHEITRGGVHPDDPKTRTSAFLGNTVSKDDKYETSACWICGKEFGWYCPDSPDHICDYGGPDWELHSEYCIYCHQPEERK